MPNAISGRKADVFLSLGNLSRSGFNELTYDAPNKQASLGSVGDDFWYSSDLYEVEIKLNGVISTPQNWVTPSSDGDTIQLKTFTYQIAGVEITQSTVSVSALTVASSGSGHEIIYTIIATVSGVFAVNTAKGTATTTRGTAGGPSFVTTNGIALKYIRRKTTGASVIVQNEILTTEFDGTQFVNPENDIEIRPLLQRVEFNALPAAVHTGSLRPKLYARFYSFSGNFVKVGQLIDVKIALVMTREDSTKQNADRPTSDRGRSSNTWSANKYISDVPDEIYSNQNKDGATDMIVKLRSDREANKWYVAQMSMGSDMDLPNADKQKSSLTGEITGHVEEIST